MREQGYWDVMSAAGLAFEKIAKQKLWDMLEVIPTAKGYVLKAPGIAEDIGSLYIKPGGQVSLSSIDERFRGMGLGKKLYGHAMRRQPYAALVSDSLNTSGSAPIWARMSRRPDYGFWQNEGAKIEADPDAITPAINRLQAAMISPSGLSTRGDTREAMEGLGRAYIENPRSALARMFDPGRRATLDDAGRTTIQATNQHGNFAGALPLEARINPFREGEFDQFGTYSFDTDGVDYVPSPFPYDKQHLGMTEEQWLAQALEAAPYEMAGGREARAAGAAQHAALKNLEYYPEDLAEEWIDSAAGGGPLVETTIGDKIRRGLAKLLRPRERKIPAAPEGVNPELWARLQMKPKNRPELIGPRASLPG